MSEFWLCFNCCIAEQPQPKRRRRIDRSMIGEPTNFVHTAHVGSGDLFSGMNSGPVMCYFCSLDPLQQLSMCPRRRLFTSFLPSKHMDSCALHGTEAVLPIGQQDPTALQCCVRYCFIACPLMHTSLECSVSLLSSVVCFFHHAHLWVWNQYEQLFWIGSLLFAHFVMKRLLLFLLLYNVCMRKWLVAVMRCQTAQCNGMTRSTLCF